MAYIPEKRRSAFIQLATMPDSLVEALASVIDRNPAILKSKEGAISAAEQLGHIAPDEAFSLLEALVPVYYYQASKGKSAREIGDEFSKALSITKEGSELPSSAGILLSERLARLLSIPSATLNSKALSLASEAQKTFSSARIFTDVRPVFGEEISDPSAAVIVHTLRIEFVENNDDRQLFLALDGDDLDAISKVVDRAREKEKALKSFLSKSSLSVVDTKEN